MNLKKRFKWPEPQVCDALISARYQSEAGRSLVFSSRLKV
jgi:hypothetical protein